MKLRDFPTLGHVIRFAGERPKAETPPAGPAPSRAATPPEASIREKVLDIVAEKTGYPKEMLDPDLDLEADLGIDTVKQAEMFASVRAAFDIPRDPESEAARLSHPGPRHPIRRGGARRNQTGFRTGCSCRTGCSGLR